MKTTVSAHPFLPHAPVSPRALVWSLLVGLTLALPILSVMRLLPLPAPDETIVALRFPPASVGWHPFLVRAALVGGLPLVLGLGFWRHYRINLTPDLARQKELLQQLN